MGKSEVRFVKCKVCGQGYNQYPPGYKEVCWHCGGVELENLKTGTTVSRHAGQMNNPAAIPEGNIKTYLHWRKLLTGISETPYIEQDYETPLTRLKEIQKEYGLDEEWLWTAYTPITRELNKRDGLLDPFREVKRLMVYGQAYRQVLYSELYPNSSPAAKGSFYLRDYRKKREGKGTSINWPFNLLLAAIVEDCHWRGKGKKIVEALQIVKKLDIVEAENMDYDSLRRHYKKIDKSDLQTIMEALHKACSETGTPFVPEGVVISEWPPDFLARTAHIVGYKTNPYESGEKHVTDEIRKNLPPHLKKLLNRN